MSALTKNEREGLNDVFLSIHTHHSKYEKLKEISNLLKSHSKTRKIKNTLLKVKFEITALLGSQK